MPNIAPNAGLGPMSNPHALAWQRDLALKWIGFDLDDTLHSYRRASGQACEAVFEYLDEEFGCGAEELKAAYTQILKDA